MRIEIDQSGKIENTSKNTIIAFSNDEFKSIFISARDKRKIQNFFRQIGKPKVYVYRVFAVLIFILIKEKLKEIGEIVIDKEYPGKEALIKNLLLQKIRGINPCFTAKNISFEQIGKKSKAHLLGYTVYKNKRKPDLKLRSKEVLKFIVK